MLNAHSAVSVLIGYSSLHDFYICLGCSEMCVGVTINILSVSKFCNWVCDFIGKCRCVMVFMEGCKCTMF